MGKPNIIRQCERPLALLPIRSPAVSLPRERHRRHNCTNQLRSQSLSDSLHKPVLYPTSACFLLFPSVLCASSSVLRALNLFLRFLSSLSDVSCQLPLCFLLS